MSTIDTRSSWTAASKSTTPNAVSARRADVYAAAEIQMRRGKRLVVTGFGVAIVGIVGYCAACFTAGLNQELGVAFLENPGWVVGSALGVIGLGTLLWLVGSFLYLNGAMDGDPDGPDIYT